MKYFSSYFHEIFKCGSIEDLPIVKLCKEEFHLKPISKRSKYESDVASVNGHLLYLGKGEEECKHRIKCLRHLGPKS